MPETAFILAAGKGTRLRPYTDNIPKPMAQLNGKPILGYIIEKLIAVGIKKIIINLHYKGEVIEDFISQYKDIKIILSKESELLDTGGGIKNALHHIDEEEFFLINGDAFWINNTSQNLFKNMHFAWKKDSMDMLLLLQDVSNMKLTVGVGDYNLSADSIATRSLEKKGEYMFTGIRLIKKSAIERYTETAFSFLKVMDDIQSNKKLYGQAFQGDWHHISTPQDLENVDLFLRDNA